MNKFIRLKGNIFISVRDITGAYFDNQSTPEGLSKPLMHVSFHKNDTIPIYDEEDKETILKYLKENTINNEQSNEEIKKEESYEKVFDIINVQDSNVEKTTYTEQQILDKFKVTNSLLFGGVLSFCEKAEIGDSISYVVHGKYKNKIVRVK